MTMDNKLGQVLSTNLMDRHDARPGLSVCDLGQAVATPGKGQDPAACMPLCPSGCGEYAVEPGCTLKWGVV